MKDREELIASWYDQMDISIDSIHMLLSTTHTKAALIASWNIIEKLDSFQKFLYIQIV